MNVKSDRVNIGDNILCIISLFSMKRNILNATCVSNSVIENVLITDKQRPMMNGHEQPLYTILYGPNEMAHNDLDLNHTIRHS